MFGDISWQLTRKSFPFDVSVAWTRTILNTLHGIRKDTTQRRQPILFVCLSHLKAKQDDSTTKLRLHDIQMFNPNEPQVREHPSLGYRFSDAKSAVSWLVFDKNYFADRTQLCVTKSSDP